jgi:adenosyl cobinamide kinase/adenosyl cobinamide phosphate guanylyltransferase
MITLVLGGARSGKSEVGEQIAASLPQPVTYLATAVPGDDADFVARIAAHKDRRPSSWLTIEAGSELIGVLAGTEGTVLVDSLGTWVSATPDFEIDGPGLCWALRSRSGSTVIVSEEVGLGVHPSTAVGGRFRDVLGTLNQSVSAAADEVLLVVAGRSLRLGGHVTMTGPMGVTPTPPSVRLDR